jgi:hypothetical protein
MRENINVKKTTTFKKEKIQTQFNGRLLQQDNHGMRRKYFARVN